MFPMMNAMERDQHDRFLRLYVAHEEALRGFVRSLVPTLEDAREVMQEVAVVLWRKADHLPPADDFRRWAFGVARLEALDFLRTRRRDRHVFSDAFLLTLADESIGAGDSFERERIALAACRICRPAGVNSSRRRTRPECALIPSRPGSGGRRWPSTNPFTVSAWLCSPARSATSQTMPSHE